MSDLANTEEWFRRAVPTPNQRTFDVQVGVHFEEVSEMVAALTGEGESLILLRGLQAQLEALGRKLKDGTCSVRIQDRKEFLDGCVDQVVTATGSAYMAHMKPAEGLNRVNTSNWSKFDENGNAIFDENGKIKKGPNFHRPNLEGLY